MCTQKKNQFMKSKKFHLVSLGCSKNTVDAESMSQLLVGSGYQPTSDPTEAEILIVNTCGFIHAAREESYQVRRTKKNGKFWLLQAAYLNVTGKLSDNECPKLMVCWALAGGWILQTL
jgi:ribosomal protein S12 methylthiotransferase